MRVVADTNVVVSGSLWHGAPRLFLDRARSGDIKLFTSPALLAELKEVLSRDRFAHRLKLASTSPEELVLGYAAVAAVIDAPSIAPVILADPKDDEVLACALAARADVIVSGDNHLQSLKEHRGISILSANEFLASPQILGAE